MSRIGKSPILVPASVNCKFSSNFFVAKGNLGTLSVFVPLGINFKFSENFIFITIDESSKKNKILWGTIRSLVFNAIHGVCKGFEKRLVINGVGYRALVKGGNLVLFLGYSHEINYCIPSGIDIKCDTSTSIIIKGIDRQLVGQVASKIRSFRKSEPYKGKGLKYFDEIIFRKEGKKK